MALISCKKCGKSISDTAEKCVHCGTLLNATEDIETEISEKDLTQKKDTKEKKGKDFLSLPTEEKTNLEKEFLSQDPAAQKYKRIDVELSNLISGKWIFLHFLMYAAYLFIDLKGKYYNSNLLVMARYLIAAIIILFDVVIPIVGGITNLIRSNRIKRLIYCKKFQKWLKEKKNIDYSIVFKKESEKEIFEGIDLNVMDL